MSREPLRLLVLTIVASSLAVAPSGEERGGASPPVPPRDGVDGPVVIRPEAGPDPRPEPLGLTLPRPYRPGAIPVVFIHGLWGWPRAFDPMIAALEADPDLRRSYQFWTFGYSTDESIPYSALLLRQTLDAARQAFDPERDDPTFDRMVLVGHSMGGVLAHMMAQDSRPGLGVWESFSDHPFDAMRGLPQDIELVRRVVFYEHRPEVARVIFIAVPHRGSRLNAGGLHDLGRRLVRLPEPLHRCRDRLVAANGADFFKDRFREELPSSLDQLRPDDPLLLRIRELGFAPAVAYHSIIADLGILPAPGGTDGVVPYESSHLPGAGSELVIRGGHACLGHPAAIAEVRRILVEHLHHAPGPATSGLKPPLGTSSRGPSSEPHEGEARR